MAEENKPFIGCVATAAELSDGPEFSKVVE